MRSLWLLLIALGLATVWSHVAIAQESEPVDEEQPDEEQLAPGLFANYTDATGHAIRRIDPAITFAWKERAPDPRVDAKGWSAEWTGQLLVLAPGEYRLHFFAAGKVELEIDAQSLVLSASSDADWHVSQPVDLAFGHHPIRVRYQRNESPAQIGLYWSGPQFQLEPVPAWHLFHEAGDNEGGSFERGATLVHALRCGACHEQLARQKVLPAPALDRLAGNVSHEWLVHWIQTAGHGETKEPATGGTSSIASRMPALGLSPDDARAIAAHLLSNSNPIERESHSSETKASAEEGATLFRTVGCLACHRVNQLGQGGPFGGGDLTRVADKRPADYFALWLRDPVALNATHRMPVFELSDDEVAHLAAYLATLKSPHETANRAADTLRETNDDVREHGARLVAEHRCRNCHQLPSTAENRDLRKSIPLPKPIAGKADCLGSPDLAAARPGFILREQDAAAVRSYLLVLASHDKALGDRSANEELDGRLVLAERNCLSCHARGLEPGIAQELPALLEVDEALAPRLAALAPPALNSVGDKLHDAALAAAIGATSKRLRPWLEVRMPRFSLSEEESRALVEMFVDEDRLPPVPETEPTASLDEASLQLAGSRLVTSAGFGCTSCHAIGEIAPVEVALAARGTDLAELGSRIRRPWYDRWVRNPARIVPRMEMPSIQLPIRGVLGEQLDDQLAAVWHVLNQRDFVPPPPDAVRVVRSRNLADDHDAHVLTDVLEIGKRKLVKPLLVGLPNRHNVLFDLAENQLAGWWIGDTARQRTRGKTWYWEPAGAFLFEFDGKASELVLERDGKRHEPLCSGQFRTEGDVWQHLHDGLRFEHRLHFATEDSNTSEPTVLQVSQQFAALRASAEVATETGFRRRVELNGVPIGSIARLALLPKIHSEGTGDALHTTDRDVTWKSPLGNCRVRVVAPTDATLSVEGGRPWLMFAAATDAKPCTIELEYTTSAPIDSFPVDTLAAPAPLPTKIDVVPGFTAERLPLVDEIMPTGLAWRPDGTLVFSSLKGQVWQARDTDGDGLEDTAAVLSDELAAPYGVAIARDAVDVINKYALLRLYDEDGDGRAERTERLASGWGHTDDYHDWAVGLVRDQSDAYYIALPCQQDKREAAEAHLRGRALRLIPQEPSNRDPARFALEELCAGLRFPMGLALNGAGDLFATDNQGNYTPFNELNHLQPGRRYGFINRLENVNGFHPEFTPAAVNIPHPWTRSVNGICFLHTPAEVRQKLGRDLFGPFEGHLVGCEYDTRSLVRMSLECVGGIYQGAVYPFSRPPAEGEQSLLGPLVCQVAPDGDLYIGNIRDSAWGGGANNGSLVRLRAEETLPVGIAEVRANRDGFEIRFTQPVDDLAAREAKFYSLSSFRRIPTPDYGGPDQDRRTEKILAVEPAADARSVHLKLGELREGFVYEIRIRSREGTRWEPAEAYYTLNRRPE